MIKRNLSGNEVMELEVKLIKKRLWHLDDGPFYTKIKLVDGTFAMMGSIQGAPPSIIRGAVSAMRNSFYYLKELGISRGMASEVCNFDDIKLVGYPDLSHTEIFKHSLEYDYKVKFLVDYVSNSGQAQIIHHIREISPQFI